MSTGKYEKDSPLSDLIPIEGAFVSTLLGNMPPLFVKVYIYLLYLCRHGELKINTISSAASAAGCTEKEFCEALEYLNQHFLINYTSRPFTFEIRSAGSAAKNEGAYAPSSLTAYADYFAGIRSLFPGRSISNSEYDKARDWVELYGLSVETALMLIAHCIETKEKSISFSYIDKAALSWANDGIITSDAAEKYLTMYQAKHHEAAKLLLYLGIKRVPTAEEMKLYQKWTNDMGFSYKAILAACSETTKTNNPTFAYINRILETLLSLGLTQEKAIKAYLAESDGDRRLVSAILFELGERVRSVATTHIEKIKEYKASGFQEDALLTAAKLCCEKNIHSFLNYTGQWDTLKENSAFTSAQIAQAFSAAAPAGESRKASASFSGRTETYGDDMYADLDKLEV